MEENKEIVKVYSTYTEAQKRATKKYRDNNKEKVNEQRKKYYINRKTKDPNFLLYKRNKAKEYYQKKKERQALLNKAVDVVINKANEETELNKLIEDVKIEEPIKKEPEIIEHPVIDETLSEKKKRKYKKNIKKI